MSAARARVAVVGAGVVGLSVAWQLRERGVSCVVYERSGIGAGASGVQPGGVRQQWGTRVNCLMARRSLELYRRLETPLARFDACGYLFVAHRDRTLAELERAVALQNELGIPSRLLDPDTAMDLVPGLRADELAGAAFCAEDGYFDRPQGIVEALAEEARVELREVRELGELDAEHVVVAAGYDTPALLPALPIEREPRHLFFSEPVAERLLEPLVVAPDLHFAAKQLADGRVLASDLSAEGTEEERRARVREAIARLLPRLEYVSLPLLVEGWYDVTPDRQAILGRLGERVTVAAGFSGHGFMMAPEAGRAVAAILAGEPSPYPELAPERFAGSALAREPQVV